MEVTMVLQSEVNIKLNMNPEIWRATYSCTLSGRFVLVKGWKLVSVERPRRAGSLKRGGNLSYTSST